MEKYNTVQKVSSEDNFTSMVELVKRLPDGVKLMKLPNGMEVVKFPEDPEIQKKVIRTLFSQKEEPTGIRIRDGENKSHKTTFYRLLPNREKRWRKHRRTWSEKGEIPPWKKR